MLKPRSSSRRTTAGRTRRGLLIVLWIGALAGTPAGAASAATISETDEAESRPHPAASRLRLVDPAGRPFAGVQVSVVGRSGAVTTDEQGVFRLLAAPPPPFELAVFDARGALIGVVRVEALGDGASHELVLEPAPLERVTVLSGAAPSTAAPPAAAATVVSAADKLERRPDRLVDVLEEVPGASQVGSGASAVPSLRGLARGRTLILVDDARVTAERRAGPSATFLDPFSIESLEIIRGPGSVAYGSDALGGVIHARTPLPRHDAFAGRFEAGGGVGEPFVSGAFEVNAPLGRGAVLAQGHARSTDDYDSPRGEVPDSSSRDRGALVRVLVPAGSTRLLLGLQSDRARDVGRPLDDPAGTRTIYPNEESDRLTLRVDLPPRGGFTSLELRGFVGRYRLVTDRIEPNPTGEIERADVDADDASLRMIATRGIPGGLLRLGFDASSRFGLRARNLTFQQQPGGDPMPTGLQDSIVSARRIDGGVFAEVERVLPALPGSLAAGLRGNRVEARNSGGSFGDRSTSNDNLSGYVALSWQPVRRWSGSLQYARGFRDARLSDRYFSGVTGRGTIVGNPDLRPETSEQFDLAVHGTLGATRLSAYGYHYRVSDLIERFRIAPGSDVFNFANLGEVQLRGVEVEADVSLPRELDLRVTANYADGSVREDGSAPDDVPPESLTASLRHRSGRHWWRVVITAFARDDEPGGNERPTPGYAVLDASAGFELRPGLEARVFLRNVADREYPSSSDERAPLAAGRSLALVLAGSF